MIFQRSKMACQATRARYAVLWLVALTVALAGSQAQAQFDSGSTGADGALTLTTPGTVVFDPTTFVPPLDPDNDNVYHFTTITIGAGVTVQLTVDKLSYRPVVWLASGDVQIDGNIDLSGAQGYDWGSPPVAAAPGPGGGAGGLGRLPSIGQPAQAGSGLGGGGVTSGERGSGGGYATAGSGPAGGPSYGNEFVQPLLGGSGGSGGDGGGGGGGGAGGGALLIASSGTITVTGAITANGGPSGFNGCPYWWDCHGGWGGGGSGGAIRLVASTVAGSGALQASAQPRYGEPGGSGRIRLEAYHQQFLGSSNPTATASTPNVVFLSSNAPTVCVVSVAGAAVPPNPTASFTLPDVTINEGGTVTIAIEAHNIPLGTTVHLRIVPEVGAVLDTDSTPLAGTVATSTATASVTVPAGFSRFYTQATWTPSP